MIINDKNCEKLSKLTKKDKNVFILFQPTQNQKIGYWVLVF